MRPDFLPTLLLLLLCALLLWAALTDLRARIITNGLNGAIALLAPLYWWSIGLPLWPDAVVQVGLAIGVLALLIGLFALGAMGGGDVKLLAALALWLPPGAVLTLLVLTSLLGAPVTIAAVAHHRFTRRIGRAEIPYGVAIALAGLWVIGEPFFNHSA